MTPLIITILRLLHIFASVFWVGATFLMVLVIEPAIAASGPDGRGIMGVLNRGNRYSLAMSIAAVLTTLAGVLLYLIVPGGSMAFWTASLRGWVLTLGAVAGIAAFVVGFAMQGRASAQLGRIMGQVQAAQGPPTPAQQAEIARWQRMLSLGTRISFVLMVLALAGMAGSRYIVV